MTYSSADGVKEAQSSLPMTNQDATYSELEKLPTTAAIPDIAQAEGGYHVELTGQNVDHVKLAKDGHTILLPQPTDSSEDPLNWSSFKKHAILFTIAYGAFVADFVSAAPVACILAQAEEFQRTPTAINQANSMNILLLGIGGTIMCPLSTFWGRAPILFWTALMAVFFNLGCVLSNDFPTYYGMRSLVGIVSNAAPTIAIGLLQDMFFFHERARKIGLWTVCFIVSPVVGPLLGNFIMAKTNNTRNVLWMCFGAQTLYLVPLVLFLDETWYRRDLNSTLHPSRGSGVGARMLRLTGIWQIRNHSGYFFTLKHSVVRFVRTLFKPVLILVFIPYMVAFAWGIGLNISSSILFATPREYGGYGYNSLQLGYLYFTAVVAIFLGELIGHFANDWLAKFYIRRHKGVFEAEARLPMMYVAIGLMVIGLIVLGQALEQHMNVGVIIFGWGIYVCGIMLHSVALFAYSVDAYPTAPAEVAGWISLVRVIAGFSVGYFQEPWGAAVGYGASFGTQAAITGFCALFIVIVHIYGHRWRVKGGGVN